MIENNITPRENLMIITHVLGLYAWCFVSVYYTDNIPTLAIRFLIVSLISGVGLFVYIIRLMTGHLELDTWHYIILLHPMTGIIILTISVINLLIN